jgi:hypothetical protein
VTGNYEAQNFIVHYFFLFVLLCGCVHTTTSKNLTPAESPAPLVTPQPTPADFSVNISVESPPEGFNNITRTITRNFSEITADNYTDIPNLLARYDEYPCGYNETANYIRVSEVAFSDSRVQDMLRDGAIVEGIFFYYDRGHTKESNVDTCARVYVTMEFQYKGKPFEVILNETTQRVIFPDDSLQYVNTPLRGP